MNFTIMETNPTTGIINEVHFDIEPALEPGKYIRFDNFKDTRLPGWIFSTEAEAFCDAVTLHAALGFVIGCVSVDKD